MYNLDPTRKGFGYGVNGAMTEYVKVPSRCLHKVPDGLALDRACLTEPCCVAYNAVVMNGNVKPGDRIVVLGPGPIGLLCAAMGAASRSHRGCGRSGPRSGAARHRENSMAAKSSIGDCRDWAFSGDGLGVDGVVDAAGISITLKTAIDIVRPAGWISKVGWGRDPVGFSLDPMVQKNVTLQGSFSHNWAMWERVLRLLSTGLLNIDPVCRRDLDAGALARSVRDDAQRSDRQGGPHTSLSQNHSFEPFPTGDLCNSVSSAQSCPIRRRTGVRVRSGCWLRLCGADVLARQQGERRYAGVTHVDVTDFKISDASAAQGRRAVRIAISGLGYYPNPLTPNEDEAHTATRHIQRVIAASAMLGIGRMNTFVGRDWTKSVDDNWPSSSRNGGR